MTAIARRVGVPWLAILAGVFLNSVAIHAQQVQVFRGQTMGPIQYEVRIADPQVPAETKAAIQERLDEVNRLMSTYRPDSDISRFNASTSTDWFPVDLLTATVVARANELSASTQGAFDVTVGPAVELWKFGTDRETPRLPTEAELTAVLEQIGYQKIQTRLDPPCLRKSKAQVKIDLSAIAKGFAVDRVAARLRELGLKNFMVDVGGEIVVLGNKPHGAPWTIGIERPNDTQREPDRVLELTDTALASSGDYRNFYLLDGKRYSHTIDPRTAQPVTWPDDGQVAAASVIADDCMTADALATALMVLGPDEGLTLAENLEASGLVFLRRADGSFSARLSGEFPTGTSIPRRQPVASNFFSTLAITTCVFILVVVAMSIGVIFAGKRIKGSCGGIAALESGDVNSACSMCSTPKDECSKLKKEIQERQQANAKA